MPADVNHNYMNPEIFNDYRPYCDEEINPAMKRISEDKYFPLLAGFIFPGMKTGEVSEMFHNLTTIYQFQSQVMSVFNEQVIKRSISKFSVEGIDGLDANKRYLFVSNHRDIVLDSSLLQYALHTANHHTTEITFGSNLMVGQLVIDIGKSNKMFKLVRGGSPKEMYANSLHLSQYIRHTILEKQESVWIAQRNGRTKNGIDTTDQGLIKVFYMGSPDNPAKAVAELNIVPVSISYQWESCDILKTIELYQSRNDKYIKKPDEDLHSILTGINQPKGDVHIHIGKPISENDLSPYSSLPNNKFNRQVASLIDKQVIANYKLSCNNYIAHDIRSRSSQYAGEYTPEEKDLFLQHLQKLDEYEVSDKHALTDIFLGIYANPVDAKVCISKNKCDIQ